MPRYEVVPHVGIGPVRLGMSRTESRAVMAAGGQEPDPFRKTAESTQETDAYHRSAFQVFFDDAGYVEYVELSRGERSCVPLYRGHRILTLPADAALAVLAADAPFDPTDEQVPYSYTFPALELAVWRPALSGRDGRTFATIGVGRPGYFSART